MAWAIDTNFGSGLFTTDARAPFPTGGGNRMLAMAGAGVIYRSDVDELDIEISCDLMWEGDTSTTDRLVALILRRQPDGSFYFVDLGYNSSNRRTISIGRYNGVSDTTTFIAFGTLLQTDPLAWDPGDLLEFKFRIQGDNLLATLFNNNAGSVLIQTVGTNDSTITLSGNPGIGSQVSSNGVMVVVPHFTDNFTVNKI